MTEIILPKMYFAHPLSTYNTDLENMLIEIIKARFPGYELENPNQPHHQKACQEAKEKTGNAMNYFLNDLIPKMDAGIALPFKDNMFGAGIFAEMEGIYQRKKPIWQIDFQGKIDPLDRMDERRRLSIEDTRARVRDINYLI